MSPQKCQNVMLTEKQDATNHGMDLTKIPAAPLWKQAAMWRKPAPPENPRQSWRRLGEGQERARASHPRTLRTGLLFATWKIQFSPKGVRGFIFNDFTLF